VPRYISIDAIDLAFFSLPSSELEDGLQSGVPRSI
jgi:hypothetical protein